MRCRPTDIQRQWQIADRNRQVAQLWQRDCATVPLWFINGCTWRLHTRVQVIECVRPILHADRSGPRKCLSRQLIQEGMNNAHRSEADELPARLPHENNRKLAERELKMRWTSWHKKLENNKKSPLKASSVWGEEFDLRSSLSVLHMVTSSSHICVNVAVQCTTLPNAARLHAHCYQQHSNNRNTSHCMTHTSETLYSLHKLPTNWWPRRSLPNVVQLPVHCAHC